MRTEREPERTEAPGKMYTRLVSSLLFPLHERLKGYSTVRVRRFLERSQWWSAEELAAYQVTRLRNLLIDVRSRVPYYRKLFDRIEFHPDRLTSVDDLSGLSLLTKELIRANSEELKAEGARDLARFNTGGSTGEPLRFFTSKERVSHDVAAKWRATRWWGVDVGDPEVVVWGSPIELSAQDRLRGWRDKMLRSHLLPAFEMSPEGLDRFVETIRRVRPRMLFGYPSALALIADHAESRGRCMADLGIEVAFVTAERLYGHQRERIERTFGCRVANGYGGRDSGFIAHECPEGSMHVTAEDIVVEIVGRDGRVLPKGETGEVVVTHLATREFPFVRYRTGDVAVLNESPCRCGRGLPVMTEIQGRTTDFVVAADGTVMHGLALIYVIRDVAGIENFRIIQEDLKHVRVQLVTGPGFQEDALETIRSGLVRRLGPDVDVSVERVSGISPTASGKYQYVVSRVAPTVG